MESLILFAVLLIIGCSETNLPSEIVINLDSSNYVKEEINIDKSKSKIVKKNTLQSRNLKGKVRELREDDYRGLNYYSINKLRTNTKPLLTYIDTLGYRISDVTLDEFGQFYSKSKYIFGNNNLIVGKEILDKDSNIISKIDYLYSDVENELIGRIHVIENLNDIPNEYSFSYEYDEFGNEIKAFKINKGGEIVQTVLTEYKNDKIDLVFFFDENKNVIMKQNYIYNQNGDLIANKYYNANDKLIEHVNYKYDYDNIGNWIVKYTYVKFTLSNYSNKIDPKSKLVYVTTRDIKYYD